MAENKTYEVLYNDEVVATLAPGEKVEIHCAGQIMDYSLVVRPVADVVMISFTINITTYQAEEGMTWAEWIASSYNTGGYYLDGGNGVTSGYYMVSAGGSISEKGTDVIVADYTYIYYTPGGGGGKD